MSVEILINWKNVDLVLTIPVDTIITNGQKRLHSLDISHFLETQMWLACNKSIKILRIEKNTTFLYIPRDSFLFSLSLMIFLFDISLARSLLTKYLNKYEE